MNMKTKARTRRIITYLGALTVVATFVFREIVQDKAKDDLSAIDSKRGSFLERLEIIEAEKETLIATGRWEMASNSQEQSQTKLTTLAIRLTIMIKTIAITREMVNDIDMGKTTMQRLDRLLENVRGVATDLSTSFDNVKGKNLKHGNGNALNDLEKRIEKDEEESGYVTSFVMQFAKDKRTLDAEGIDSINYYSFVLFGLGWVVNLYGHLIPGDEKEEEDTDWEEDFLS